jgi:pimeloyl-ACP methyl ester carboxylesterase
MPIGPIDVCFDAVTGSAPAEIAGWLFAPSRDELASDVRVFVCLPGGSYTKAYYHLQVPGHPDYSMGENLAGKGHVVVALDPLGIGGSTVPKGEGQLLPAAITTATDAAARQALAGLRAGTLLPDLGPLPDLVSVGVGHSIGGMLVTVQQADHGTFDALAILGFATTDVRPDQLVAAQRAMKGDADDLDFGALGEHVTIERDVLRDLFHYPDVPEEVIAADNALAVGVLRDAALYTMVPSLVVDKTQSLDVPLFLGFGEVDADLDFRRESANYINATDITLYRLPRSGHCSNFASTRRQLWDRLAAWALSIAN